MKRSIVSGAIALLFAAVFWACSSSTEPGVTQEFPNAVGNQWVYAVHSATAGVPRVDTALVRIVLRSSTVVSGEPPDTARESRPAMVWEIHLRGHVDSLLAIRFTNSVDVNPMTVDGRWLYRRIRFPLAVGAEWNVPLGHEVVTAKEAVAVPAGTFTDAFRIEGSYGAGSERTYWFRNGLGMLALDIRSSGAVERWELVRYELR